MKIYVDWKIIGNIGTSLKLYLIIFVIVFPPLVIEINYFGVLKCFVNNIDILPWYFDLMLYQYQITYSLTEKITVKESCISRKKHKSSFTV